MTKESTAAVGISVPTPKKWENLERHELSERFALPTTPEERLALATDIEKNGQHQDILLFEGKILDGWERYLACRQKGKEPSFKEYRGDRPAATAFGVNTIRRRLSSVQKATFGAVYWAHVENTPEAMPQKDVAKLACCSLTRLSEVLQLMRKDTAEAKRCMKTLREDAEVSGSVLQQMLIDCGVIDPKRRVEVNDGTPDSGVGEDDATGGLDIDALLGETKGPDDDEDDEDEEDDNADAKKSPTKHSTPSSHRAQETPASALARTFKGLTAVERLDFVRFTWPTLRTTLEQALLDGRITWQMLGVQSNPAAAALADAVNKLAPTAPVTAAVKSKARSANTSAEHAKVAAAEAQKAIGKAAAKGKAKRSTKATV